MSTVAKIHQGLGFLFLLLGIVMFFLAGRGAFGAGSYDPHSTLGSFLGLLALIILILAAVGRREALAASAALLVLTIVQTLLGTIGDDVGILGALHPVNALLVLAAAHQAARGLPLPAGGRSSRTPSRA